MCIRDRRELAQKLGKALGTVNKTMTQLQSLGYAREGKITQEGLLALEPYRVKRAVFIAAGFGSRLVPITLNTPKPVSYTHLDVYKRQGWKSTGYCGTYAIFWLPQGGKTDGKGF